MSYGLDVNGFDNQPEWGYCHAPGCTEAAYPIWLSGGPPDDPDLLLCDTHIGRHIAAQDSDLARARSDLATAIQSRDQARSAEAAERDKRTALESQLGAAYEEITRLTEALRQVRRKLSIRGARKVVDQAIGKEQG